MIVFNCPQCNLELKVLPEHAGQSGNCRHCGTKLRVPSQSAAKKAASSGAAAAPVENVAFESVQGFDDIASGIAEQYDPVEAPVEKEEAAPMRRQRPDNKTPGAGPQLRLIYVLVPVLLVVAVAMWYVFYLPPAVEPLPEIHRVPQQELAQAMSYLNDKNLFKHVEWTDVRPDQGVVVVGWRLDQHVPGSEAMSKRLAINAATIASDAIRGRATVYLVDADRFNQTWTPNQGGIIEQVQANNGIIE